jgi:D-threo-aldose 1-dehydrogenase
MSLEPIGKSRIGFPSRLGFGASGIGTLYRDVPQAQAQEVLHSAYDAGFRYFDTAPLYGHGLSELRLGQFLRTVPRQSFTVSTKVGRYLVPPRGEDVDYGIWASPQ